MVPLRDPLYKLQAFRRIADGLVKDSVTVLKQMGIPDDIIAAALADGVAAARLRIRKARK